MSLMSFIQEKTIHGFGQCRASQAVRHSFQRIWDKSEFHRAFQEAMQKQGMIGWEVKDLQIRQAGPVS